MSLLTVTLTWDFTDALQAGESAFLQAVPTGTPWLNAAGETIVDSEPLTQPFTGGPGSLAGIVANDNGLTPAGQGYQVTVRKANGTVLYDETVILNHAAGASQDLSGLTPAVPVSALSEFLLAASNLSDVASPPAALASLGGATAAGLAAETARATAAEVALLPRTPWLPGDNGFLAATDDLGACGATAVMAAGTVYLRKLPVRYALTISGLVVALAAAGSGTSAGSFAGVISSAGTLLTGSADIGSILTGANGGRQLPLTTPQNPAIGSFVWLAVVANLSVTQPTLRAAGGGNPTVMNANLPNSAFNTAVNGTGQAALPSSITPNSNSASGAVPFFIGVI